jgi:hypothetical protein
MGISWTNCELEFLSDLPFDSKCKQIFFKKQKYVTFENNKFKNAFSTTEADRGTNWHHNSQTVAVKIASQVNNLSTEHKNSEAEKKKLIRN